MTEQERELGAYIVGEVSAQVDRLEARFERHEEREAAQYASLTAKVDALGHGLATVNADQSKLRREVQRRLANMIDSSDVEEIVTGQHKAMELEAVKAALAKREAEAAQKVADEKRAADEIKADRRKLRYQVIGGIIVGITLLVSGVVIGRYSHTPPASAATK